MERIDINVAAFADLGSGFDGGVSIQLAQSHKHKSHCLRFVFQDKVVSFGVAADLSFGGQCQTKCSRMPGVVVDTRMSNPFRYFNSSPEVIRLVVMMYVRYPLSLRNVEDLLAERGIDISHETVRFWWNRFGPMFAAEIRKKRVAHMRGYPQWRWHLDEVFVKVNGKLCYLWRAVDHEGEVLESVVTAKRDKAAAVKFLKRIMKKYGRPRKIVTDGLRAYSAAMKEVGNADRQEVGRGLNNRAENSHQPFRRRERAMQRFRSMKTLQKFSSVHAQVHNHSHGEGRVKGEV